jgi:hypothetical protein
MDAAKTVLGIGRREMHIVGNTAQGLRKMKQALYRRLSRAAVLDLNLIA